MANSGPGSEGIDIAWEARQDEIREAQKRAFEDTPDSPVSAMTYPSTR